MIFDAILYDGEKDLLDIRLHETALFNDRVTTIIVEANATHTGNPKEPTFEKHRKDFKNFNIVYHLVDDMPVMSDHRGREKHQRNKITTALKTLEPKDNDIVLISDVDEIPRARTINLFKREIGFAALIQDKFAYFLNVLESEQSWDRARIMTFEYLKNKTPEEVRNSGYDYSMHHSGWHYSWVCDPIRKLKSFSHQELNTDENIKRIWKKENVWNDDKLKKIKIDLSHPEYLVNNISKFKHLIK